MSFTGASPATVLGLHEMVRVTFGLTDQERALQSLPLLSGGGSDFATGMASIFAAAEQGELPVAPVSDNPADGTNITGTVDFIVPSPTRVTVGEVVQALNDSVSAWAGILTGFVVVQQVQVITPAQAAGEQGVTGREAQTAGTEAGTDPWAGVRTAAKWAGVALLVGGVLYALGQARRLRRTLPV